MGARRQVSQGRAPLTKTFREPPTRSVRRLEAFQYSLTVVMLASRTRSSSPWASVKLLSKVSLAHSRLVQRSSIWTSLCPQTFRQRWPRRISVCPPQQAAEIKCYVSISRRAPQQCQKSSYELLGLTMNCESECLRTKTFVAAMLLSMQKVSQDPA